MGAWLPFVQNSPEAQNRLKIFFNRRLQSASVITNSAFLFVNSLLGAFLGAAFWVIAAQFYDLASIGLTSAMFSSATLIAVMSNLGFSGVLVRYLPLTGDAELRLSIPATLIPVSLAFLAATAFSTLPVGHSILNNLSGSPLLTYFVLALLTMTIAVSMIQDSIFVARREGLLVLITDLGGVLARFLLLLPLAGLGALGLVLTITAGSVIAIMLGATAWKKKLPSHSSPSASLRTIAAYGATVYVSGLLAQAPQLLFPILIATQVSPLAAGAFNYAWLAAALLMALPPSAANVLLAHLASDPASAQRRLRRAAPGIIVATAVLAFLTYAAMRSLLPFVLPTGMHDTLMFLPLLLLGVVLFAVVRVYSMVLSWHEKLGELLVLNGFVASLAICLPALLLPRAGVLGLEVGWLISQFLGVIAAEMIQFMSSKDGRYA